jgi:hypothetical protein
VLEAPCWVLEALEKNLRGFFWAGKEKAHGGQCLVAWQNCCKPYEFGGLNIKKHEATRLSFEGEMAMA